MGIGPVTAEAAVPAVVIAQEAPSVLSRVLPAVGKTLATGRAPTF